MKKVNPWKLSTLVLAGALTYTLAAAHLPSAQAEPQPRMKAALAALLVAKKNLKAATPDKGGHRVAALAHVNKAIAEVRKGIRFDNRH